MKKKLGLIVEAGVKGDPNYNTRRLFHEKLRRDYDVSSFSWTNVSDSRVSEAHTFDGKVSCNVALDSYDGIYLNGLGPIQGKKKRLLDFVKNLGDLETVVMNNPEAMGENFDKKYLLFLQENQIPVIPTRDVSELEYLDVNDFRFKGYSNTVVKPKFFGERSNGIIEVSKEPFSKESFKSYKGAYGNGILAQPFVEGIVKFGERSLIFVGDNFSHAIYRHRDIWNMGTAGALAPEIKPKEEELRIAEDILSVWPSKYHVTRFDFITDGAKSMISEVEMINPNIWLGSGISSVDEKFMDLFTFHLKENL